MTMSTFQKVTLATCLVLCVSLLLPKMLLSRGRKDAADRPEGSGHFPPMVHRQAAPESRSQRASGSGFSRANPESIARTKGGGTGVGAGGKSNLAGQIIPVYGFGILLYILYILFKITSKGSSKPSEGRSPPVRSENMKRKITDFELAQLQEKLRETELVMERIVSNAQHSPDRVKGVTPDQEESLLLQLTEITRVMQEGQMVEDIPQEKQIQEDWDDYTDESQLHWERSQCCCHHNPKDEAETEKNTVDMNNSTEEHSGDTTSNSRADEPEDLSTNCVNYEDMIPERDVDVKQEEDIHDKTNPGVEEDLVGVLKELELTLTMSSVLNQEKIEDDVQQAQIESSSSLVRRRNRRKKAKKATH